MGSSSELGNTFNHLESMIYRKKNEVQVYTIADIAKFFETLSKINANITK